MKKGFTLVELLGVIVILGILSLLVVPVVNNMMIESREELASAQEKAILKAAKNWGSANMFMLPDCDGRASCTEEEDSITITLGQIMNEGFLDNQTIKDVNKDKIYSPATEIVIGKSNNQNTYRIHKNEYENDIVTTEGGPTIVLEGLSTIVIEANRGEENYSEPGVIVKDKDGNTIDDYTVTVIKTSQEGDAIDQQPEILQPGYTDFGFNTKKVANYKIIYETTDKKAKMVRNVQIRDTTPPTISFVNNIEVAQSVQKSKKLYSDINTLKSDEYVTYIDSSLSSQQANSLRSEKLSKISSVVIMDNSCGKADIKLNVESTVPPDGKLGTYAITYTATDKYGNKFKKVRNVKLIEG